MPLGAWTISERWLGPNKTLGAYFYAPLLAAAFSFAPGFRWYQPLLLGLGAVLGDHLKSAIKRQLEYPPGSKWLPDRFDFALGGGLMGWAFIDWVTLFHVAILVGLALPVHYVGNLISHELGLRSTPH